MSRVSFQNYGLKAKQLNNYTVIAGRYSFQEEAEKKILLDIIKKLNIDPNDKCLDIGCGVGNILIPMSFFVKSITGIDHESCIGKLKERLSDLKNINLIPGNFLDLMLSDYFDKIVVYSVLHYLKNKDEVFEFMFKAVSLLVPGGKILFGDIPNESRKDRYLMTPQGKHIESEWNAKIKYMGKETDKPSNLLLNDLPTDMKLVGFDDNFILSIIARMRKKGYHAYILPQPPELPFGYTREDILIEKLS